MKKKNIIGFLQTLTGATKSELIFAIVIIVGLIGGLIIRMSTKDENKDLSKKNIDAVYRAIDSLAEIHKTTYTGADLYGNKVPELAAGDTVVKDYDYPFSFKKKKTLPEKSVNINTASKKELAALPGVSKKTAKKIIAYRKLKKFNKPEDIMKVKGIGKKKFKKLKRYIVVR